MASMPDPLSDDFWNRDSFDWADEVDDMVEDAVELSSVTTVETANEYNDASTEGSTSPEPEDLPNYHQRVATSPKFEYICDDIDEDLIPMPLIVTNPTTTTDPSDSSPQTIDGNDERYDEYLERLFSSVAWEFNWRNDTMDEEPHLHHFNWLGQGMFNRSNTLPEESLAVILSDPKAPQVTGDLRVESLLRNAYGYIDPVIVCLDEEVQPSLWNLRGSELQHAVKGHCFKHYTPHGRWHSDPEEAMEQNVLDAGGVNNYLNPHVVIGNGFVSNGLVPSRLDYNKRLQEKIQNASSLSQYSSTQKKRNPSPLRQSESATPLETEAANTTVATQEPNLLLPSCEVQLEDETEADTCEAGPSYSTATPAKLILQAPLTVRISKAKPSATLDPSRDPDIYYSFPTSPFRYKDSKCKRVYKKVKRYIKNKVSQLRGS